MADEAHIHEFSRGLYRFGAIFEVVALVGGGLGVLLGLLVAMDKDTEVVADVATSTHPYVTFGLAIAVAAVLNAALFWAIARGLRLYALDVNARHGGVTIVIPRRGFDVAGAAAEAAAATGIDSPAVSGSARVWSRSAPPKPPPAEPE